MYSSLKPEHMLGNDWTTLAGPIPDSLAKAQNLTALTLAHCGFTGQLPASFSNLTSLETLSLKNNSLSG